MLLENGELNSIEMAEESRLGVGCTVICDISEESNELSSDVIGDWSWLDFVVFSELDSNDIGVVFEVSNELSSDVIGDWS